MKRIVFLVSGSGGTLKFLFYAIELLRIQFDIVGVIADRQCGSLEFAQSKAIYSKKIIYTRNKVEELRTQLSHLNPDIIITNIHKIIDEETLNLWNEKFLNVHYSLLPSFSGLIGMETIKKAKEQNVKFIGGTCHSVSKEVDAGKILQQGCFGYDWENDENAGDTVFKTTCFCLLGTIYKNHSNFSESISINNHQVYFSPKLNFICEKFDNNFWKLVNNN